MNETDCRGVKYEEFREIEKAKPDYPQAGPPYDKTTYMGRIRDKVYTADNEFAKASRDYRSTVGELEDEVKKWYHLVNTAIGEIEGGADIQTIKRCLVNMRQAYIKGG